MTTPLYPAFKKRVKDAIDLLIREKVTPWSFLTAGPPFRITKFDGQQIAYEGVSFERMPRLVCWSRYIEPFLEALCISEIKVAVELAREKRVNAKLLLFELQGLLSGGCLRVYDRMAYVDRHLRGSGNPKSVKLRPIVEESQAMDRFIAERIYAEIKLRTLPFRREEWFKQNKFWVWAIPIAVTIIIGLLALLQAVKSGSN